MANGVTLYGSRGPPRGAGLRAGHLACGGKACAVGPGQRVKWEVGFGEPGRARAGRAEGCRAGLVPGVWGAGVPGDGVGDFGYDLGGVEAELHGGPRCSRRTAGREVQITRLKAEVTALKERLIALENANGNLAESTKGLAWLAASMKRSSSYGNDTRFRPGPVRRLPPRTSSRDHGVNHPAAAAFAVLACASAGLSTSYPTKVEHAYARGQRLWFASGAMHTYAARNLHPAQTAIDARSHAPRTTRRSTAPGRDRHGGGSKHP